MNAITMQENKSIKYDLRLVKQNQFVSKQGHVNHFFFTKSISLQNSEMLSNRKKKKKN